MSKDKMEFDPVASLKRQAPPASLDLCIICQTKKKEALRNGSDDGKKRLLEVSEIRRKMHDIANTEIIDRIQSFQSAT